MRLVFSLSPDPYFFLPSADCPVSISCHTRAQDPQQHLPLPLLVRDRRLTPPEHHHPLPTRRHHHLKPHPRPRPHHQPDGQLQCATVRSQQRESAVCLRRLHQRMPGGVGQPQRGGHAGKRLGQPVRVRPRLQRGTADRDGVRESRLDGLPASLHAQRESRDDTTHEKDRYFISHLVAS